MTRLLAIPAVLIGLLIGALAWSGSGSQGRADFAFVNRGDHVTLDLNNMAYMQDIRVANALYEGLYALNPVTLEPELATADHVTVNADRTAYTFHIRDGARWSNGDKVTAGDFVFEWRRMLESPREYTDLHSYIKGARAYRYAYADYAKEPRDHKPPAPDFGTVGERVNADGTLTVELENPVPFIANLLAFVPFYPANERSMEPFKKTDPATGVVSYDRAFTRPPYLVSNGPYRLQDWLFKRRLRMAANTYYWDAANVRSKTIDEVQADDPLAAYRLFKQGDVDWLSEVDPALAEPLLKRADPNLKVFPAFGTYFYELNCLDKLPDGRDNPLHDPRVRQALAMAIDKEPIVKNVGRLGQPVTTDYVPPNTFPGYHSPAGLPYDVDRARQLLAEAGYPGGKGFPRVAVTYNTETGLHGDIATIVRRQWADHLGINVEPDGLEQKQYAANLHSQNYVIARASWYGDYFDPSTFTDKYLSGSENNAAKWQDKAYDAICAKAAVEGNAEKRLALFAAAENRLLTQAPIIPLYTFVNSYLYPPKTVHGIIPNAQGTVLFKGVYRD